MATVKKSKKRIIVPIAIVLVIAIIVTSIFIVRKVNGGEQVTLHTISTGDIYETVSATGDVTAGASRTYKVGTVATVKEVFVQKGDKVKEGDKLATFDTSNVDAQISKLQGTYTDAKKAYNTARSNQTAAKSNLAADQHAGKADCQAAKACQHHYLKEEDHNEKTPHHAADHSSHNTGDYHQSNHC